MNTLITNSYEKPNWTRNYTLAIGTLIILLLITAGAGIFGKNTYTNFVVPKYVQESRAQDMITLILGIPLLMLSTWAIRKEKSWGIPLCAGTLGYELYIYAIYVIGGVYNSLFLGYAATASLALYSIIFLLSNSNLDWFQQNIGSTPPRRWTSFFFIAIVVVFSAIWIGEILNSISIGKAADGHLIFVFDLMIVLPAFGISAFKLFREQPIGDLLAGVMLIKFDSLCVSITLGQLFRSNHGISVESELLYVFIPLGIISLFLTTIYFNRLTKRK